MLNVVKTGKTQVTPKYSIPDVIYSGVAYDAWHVEEYKREDIKASYYDSTA